MEVTKTRFSLVSISAWKQVGQLVYIADFPTLVTIDRILQIRTEAVLLGCRDEGESPSAGSWPSFLGNR